MKKSICLILFLLFIGISVAEACGSGSCSACGPSCDGVGCGPDCKNPLGFKELGLNPNPGRIVRQQPSVQDKFPAKYADKDGGFYTCDDCEKPKGLEKEPLIPMAMPGGVLCNAPESSFQRGVLVAKVEFTEGTIEMADGQQGSLDKAITDLVGKPVKNISIIGHAGDLADARASSAISLNRAGLVAKEVLNRGYRVHSWSGMGNKIQKNCVEVYADISTFECQKGE